MTGEMRERGHPAYPLGQVKAAFGSGRFKVTSRVQRHLQRRGWRLDTVQGCFCNLLPADFYKSQAHRTEPGVWLDIYKPLMGNERLYVKFVKADVADVFILLSFCGDGESH